MYKTVTGPEIEIKSEKDLSLGHVGHGGVVALEDVSYLFILVLVV